MVLVLLGCGGSALGQKKNLRGSLVLRVEEERAGGLDLPLEVVEAADGLGPNPAQHVVVVNELASPKAAGKPQKVLTLPSKKPSLQSPALTTTMGRPWRRPSCLPLAGPSSSEANSDEDSDLGGVSDWCGARWVLFWSSLQDVGGLSGGRWLV